MTRRRPNSAFACRSQNKSPQFFNGSVPGPWWEYICAAAISPCFPKRVYDLHQALLSAVPLGWYEWVMHAIVQRQPDACFLVCHNGEPEAASLLKKNFDVIEVPVANPYRNDPETSVRPSSRGGFVRAGLLSGDPGHAGIQLLSLCRKCIGERICLPAATPSHEHRQACGRAHSGTQTHIGSLGYCLSPRGKRAFGPFSRWGRVGPTGGFSVAWLTSQPVRAGKPKSRYN